jgi:hypothetical protein
VEAVVEAVVDLAMELELEVVQAVEAVEAEPLD